MDLHRQKFRFQHRLTRHILGDATIHSGMADIITGEMVYQLDSFVFRTMPKTVECRYPADWWEALWERFAPQWLMKRYPVRYTRREWDIAAVFPNVVSEKDVVQIVLGARVDGNPLDND